MISPRVIPPTVSRPPRLSGTRPAPRFLLVDLGETWSCSSGRPGTGQSSRSRLLIDIAALMGRAFASGRAVPMR